MNPNEIFIGRTEIIERLSRDIFFPTDNYSRTCCSLIGSNGVGKTTLIRHIVENYNNNKPDFSFCFQKDIEAESDFWMFWGSLVYEISETINTTVLSNAPSADQHYIELIEKIYSFFKENILDLKKVNVIANMYLNKLFDYFTKIGIRIIITIDEFDRAKEVFSDGRMFQKLFGMTSKGGSALNLSIVTISRRRVSTIAVKMQEGSNFEDAFPPLTLCGFSNNEIEEYFSTYNYFNCEELPVEERNKILYLCGRSPGLLMGMRHEIELSSPSKINVTDIYKTHGQFVKVAFSRMISLLRDEQINKERTCSLLRIYLQEFIGPITEIDYQIKRKYLIDFGVATETNLLSSIYVMLGEECAEDDKLVYEPLSPYFIEYLKNELLPNELDELSGLLKKVEITTRDIISKEMQIEYPDTWSELINETAEKKNFYLENLKREAIRNDFDMVSNPLTKLNVISISELFDIMIKYKSLFIKYFSEYPTEEILKQDIQYLSRHRNLSAHHSIQICNLETREKLRNTCTKYLDSIDKGINNKLVEKQPILLKSNETNNNHELINEVIVITQLKKTKKLGITGIIPSTEEKVIISPIELEGMIGKGFSITYLCNCSQLKVTISSWNNIGFYNAVNPEFIDEEVHYNPLERIGKEFKIERFEINKKGIIGFLGEQPVKVFIPNDYYIEYIKKGFSNEMIVEKGYFIATISEWDAEKLLYSVSDAKLNIDISDEDEIYSRIDKNCIIENLEKTPKKGIKGYICGTETKVIIPSKNIQRVTDNGTTLSDLISKGSIEVRITRWDNAFDYYNAEILQ